MTKVKLHWKGCLRDSRGLEPLGWALQPREETPGCVAAE